MKHIQKGGKPAALEKFERENRKTPQVAVFDGLTAEVKEAVREALLEEQGFICAYTMRRIGASGPWPDFHVEHLRPQSRYPEFQIDYANLLLCAPGGSCEWGARRKDERDVNEANFVSPLRRDCETRLAFRRDGTVRATDEKDVAATSTLDLLALNHRELVSERAEVLRRLGMEPTAAKPISAQAALRLSEKICDRNSAGAFEPYCIAIRQVAAKLARQAQERSARLRGIR